MKKYVLHYLLGAAILVTITQCRQSERDFPKVVEIENLKKTCFVPELSIPPAENTNVIYSPTILFAWEEMTNTLGSKTLFPDSAHELQTIANATSYKASLTRGEYDSKVTIDPVTGQADISAYFQKSLPFADKMEPAQDEFLFMGSPVKAFGMPYYKSKLAAATSVLYYESNDKFIIKISPKDTLQEIVLAMGFNAAGSLDKALTSIDNCIGKEALQKGISGRLDLTQGDQLLIPVIRFNLLKDFKEYATTRFTAGNKQHELKELSQRTAFLFDEEGAKVESEATFKLDYVAAPLKKKRKALVLNKPFIIMLRKKGISHPYLMVKVMNTELMVKK